MVIEKLVGNKALKVPLDLKGPSRVFSDENIKNEFSTLILPGFDTSCKKKYEKNCTPMAPEVNLKGPIRVHKGTK